MATEVQAQNPAPTSSSCTIVDAGGINFYFFEGVDSALYVRFGTGDPSMVNYTLTQILAPGFTAPFTPLACIFGVTDGQLAISVCIAVLLSAVVYSI